MTDAAERRLAATMAQMNEILESRLSIKRPDWQVYLFLITMIFMAGGLWYQVLSNTASIAENEKEVSNNSSNLIAHMQYELEHEIEQKNALILELKRSKP